MLIRVQFAFIPRARFLRISLFSSPMNCVALSREYIRICYMHSHIARRERNCALTWVVLYAVVALESKSIYIKIRVVANIIKLVSFPLPFSPLP